MAIPSLHDISKMDADALQGWWLLHRLNLHGRPLADGEMHAILCRAAEIGVDLNKTEGGQNARRR